MAPSTVQEAYDFMYKAFQLADAYRNPVIVLGDGILGQMMEPIKIKNQKSRIKNYKKPWALTGCKGRKPNVVKSFYIAEGDLEKFNLILHDKYKLIREKEQEYENLFVDDAKIILVAYGTMYRIAKSIVQDLRKKSMRVGLVRPVKLWPFPDKIFKKLMPKAGYLVLEMSSGQMLDDVRLAVSGKSKVDFLGRTGGGIPTVEEITKKIKSLIR